MTNDANIGRVRQILIVDDEAPICEMIKMFLSPEGFSVHVAGDGEQMNRILGRIAIDLIILDIRLPGKDGLTLAKELRLDSNVPIIMLTAKEDVVDRVVGLEVGADDYIAKPFDPRELLARIRSLLRRAGAPPAARGGTGETAYAKASGAACTLEFQGWRLDTESRQLFSSEGTEVPLSPTEFELLSTFAAHPGRLLSRDFLLDSACGRANSPFDRAIDVHVSHLRKKLERDPKRPALIKTVRSAGYMLNAEVSSS